uniref:Calreticulin-3 n=1 Tax=Spermophilus dauricus TaxID=99837 RepID=A0A8C9PKT5_SPEDA
MARARVLIWAVCALRLALATVYFQEEFLDGERWRNRWVQSTNDSQFGHFRVSSGKFYGHKEKDKGLQTTQNGRFYAISARFKPFSNKGKTLVIQYTVKHEQKMDCGGGYIKIFPADLDQKNLNGKSQYYIMFGPDICGFDIKKVHVILHFKNQYHSNKKSIRCKVDGFTHLYALVLRPDLSYEVKVDGQAIESGSIEYDWNLTSFRKMEESSAESKDWNQAKDAKAQDGLKPEGIDKDIWLHQKMKNTNYLTQYDLSEFENIGAIGLELWQVRSGTIFDNFLITDDEEYAENFAKATWGETKGPEREMDAIQAKEEVKKAREEDEELLAEKFHMRESHFNRYYRRDEL